MILINILLVLIISLILSDLYIKNSPKSNLNLVPINYKIKKKDGLNELIIDLKITNKSKTKETMVSNINFELDFFKSKGNEHCQNLNYQEDIYIFEKDAQPEKFSSIPEAMWWAIATLTTIGYGDVTPVTGMGKFFGAIIAIIGIGVVALPSGILASGFTDQLKRRQAQYENELSKALQDGVISSSERNKLTKIAKDMNLSEEQIKTMEKKLKEVS